jgi:hypothetical protein
MSAVLIQIVILTMFFGGVFLLSILGWKKLWFDRFGAELPVFKNIDGETRMYARTKTLSIFWSMFSPIIKSLEMDYWVTHCGADGYLYLLFQRRFLQLTVYLSLVSCASAITMNWLIVDDQEGFDWYDQTALNNKAFSNNKGWFHVVTMGLNTFLTIRMVHKTRRDARHAYQMLHSKML